MRGMSNVVAIVNPGSANGKTAKIWERVRKLMPIDIQVWQTKARGHAIELTSAALKTGAQTVVAVGGDGTINEVVNGFFEDDRAISPEAVLGIIPQGTGSDLGRSLDLPLDAMEAAFIVNNGIPRFIDVMRVRCAAGVRYGINVTSFGLGGAVAARANRMSKAMGGKISFTIATGIATLVYSPRPVSITLDHERTIETRITNIAVGNGRYHGAGMLVCPGAKFDDGLLDVTVIGPMKLPEMAANRRILYNGKILEHPKIQSHRVRYLRAESSEPTLIEVDGESAGQLPIEIEVLPKALRILA